VSRSVANESRQPLLRSLLKPLRRLLSWVTGEPLLRWRLRSAGLIAEVRRPSSALRIVWDQLTVAGWAYDQKRGHPAAVRVAVAGRKILARTVDPEAPGVTATQGAGVPASAGFTLTIPLLSGPRWCRIQVQRGDGRWLTVRRTLLIMLSPPTTWRRLRGESYRSWVRHDDHIVSVDQAEIRRHIDAMLERPQFSIVLQAATPVRWHDTMESIRRQSYAPLEVIAVSPHEDVTPVLRDAGCRVIASWDDLSWDGSHVIFLEGGERLHPLALYEFAGRINVVPDLDIVYADEDSMTPGGRRYAPFHKPGWSPDYLEAFDYLGLPVCYRSNVVQDCRTLRSRHARAICVTNTPRRVEHIAKVLGHRPSTTAAGPSRADMPEEARHCLQMRLAATRRGGAVVHDGPDCLVVQQRPLDPPLVSIVIPTAGREQVVGRRHIDLIVNLVTQLRERTSYSAYEIIVVDNGDLRPSQLRALAAQGCRRMSFDGPTINIPAKLNQGVAVSRGDYLLLLNDDIELADPNWLACLMAHAIKPWVGVVGCKLLYPDGRIQHAGVVLVDGRPVHVCRKFDRRCRGSFHSLAVPRNFSAVTGACMLTPRRVFDAVGGYDESFPVNYNDIDYCLKVRQAGWHIVCEQRIELTHLESVSRPLVCDMAEETRFTKRWSHGLAEDEFYNAAFLTTCPPDFRPWVNRHLL
jgi:hypothetical protein